jgi:hypothetical protein
MYWFEDYAVLGDDVVIADHAVAMKYLHVLARLGVSVNLAKSVRSRGGTLEFAKRFIWGGIDCSPPSPVAFEVAFGNMSVFESLLRTCGLLVRPKWASVCRAIGLSMKDRSRADCPLSSPSRLRGLALFLMRPGGYYGVSDWLSWYALGLPGLPPGVFESLKVRSIDRFKKLCHQRRLNMVMLPFLWQKALSSSLFQGEDRHYVLKALDVLILDPITRAANEVLWDVGLAIRALQRVEPTPVNGT